MTSKNSYRLTRDRVVSELKRELMGPSEEKETIPEFPTSRYIVGRLAPGRAQIDPEEIEKYTDDNQLETDAEDETADEFSILGFHPSSVGLSFVISKEVFTLEVEVSWANYVYHDESELWQRIPVSGKVENIKVNSLSTNSRIVLSNSTQNPAEVRIIDLNDPEISLEISLNEISAYRAVSIFLLNNRIKGEKNDHCKDEKWLFQASLRITSSDSSPVFLSKNIIRDEESTFETEIQLNELLYDHVREFATGHGIAADWLVSEDFPDTANIIFTEFIPQCEIPKMQNAEIDSNELSLDMKELSDVENPTELVHKLSPLVVQYSDWIMALRESSLFSNLQKEKKFGEIVQTNLLNCEECRNRIEKGIELLKNDRDVFESFRLMNRVMWDQRIYSLLAVENRKTGETNAHISSFDNAYSRTWRLFQMGFILLNLESLANRNSEDRKTVDLLWFPTGGGKTEAYLGLSAFIILLRRIRKAQGGYDSSAGVSVIMRYTLRLLTIQQFQRAAALICSLEIERKANVDLLGAEPILIGMWVGGSTTPNTFEESKNAIERLNQNDTVSGASPVQIVTCPRCGFHLIGDNGFPKRKEYYVIDTIAKRTKIFCGNDECEFSMNASGENGGLPVVVVDEEIYRTCPSLIVATVDKFAQLAFKGEAKAIFGLRSSYHSNYSHLTDANEDYQKGRNKSKVIDAKKLLPPELIIQDELHLISGPLGSMVGLYETVVDLASHVENDKDHFFPPKIIASTATIRRAEHQVANLYGRKLKIFPPVALSSKDSFFAREQSINFDDDSTSGRLYLGINAPGVSTKTLLVRVYAVLLASAKKEFESDENIADPYMTLLGYFNSLRALGGARRLVEDDINLVRLEYLTKQRDFPKRRLRDPVELTSRMVSWRIPGILKRLEYKFTTNNPVSTIDVLLATNMISVGVDIDRLGLIAVTGQPKSTSEYIQATSRIGRKFPGLVVTMYNWLGIRDRSHYEKFKSYHFALYKHVEATSVTPFSSRALDRGLKGIYVALIRMLGDSMSSVDAAQKYDANALIVKRVMSFICERARVVVGEREREVLKRSLELYSRRWETLSKHPLKYTWNRDISPPNNTKVLIKALGSNGIGEWNVPGSLREVESQAGFYLHEDL
ncbi:DISARM system helicase DrmA [Leptospira interrogans]|nr:DISARM system helicase DrmA [Leptospira interrogans]MBM2888544.1 helicase [Leptospira interrogans]